MTDPRPHLTLDLPHEAATALLAVDLAAALRVGDIVALHGDLGAGKTTLARALIRAMAGDPGLEVPSPTFTLVQTYETGRGQVAHFDLYRIADPDETDEIGLDAAAGEAIVLVEWPERAGDRLPQDRLDLRLEMAGSGRRARMSAPAPLLERVERTLAARALLAAAGMGKAHRTPVTGDASARRYERATEDGRNAIVMDWPPVGQLAPDDPRVRFRARGAATFVAVAEALRTAGLSTPEVYASDPATGLVVMEDFGSPGLAVDGEPDPARYAAAIDALVRLHAEPRADRIPSNATDGEHVLPRLTGDALRAELTLFANAYAPMVRGAPLTDPARADLLDIWSALDRSLQETEKGWVLFDVQSPNLFWLPERSGIRRVGLIDFQDMFFGPTAYDVASLVQDARVTVPDSLALRLVQQYVSGRTALVPSFDHQLFVRGLWIGAALRQSKNLGALSHMVNRGKTNYASHLPRLRAYLERALSHPVLSDLSVWYDTHLTPKNQVAP